MRVAVTGTPGTGKTTAVERAETDLDVVHLNRVIRERGFDRGTDEDRGSLVAGLDAVADWLEGRDDMLVESHLAHLFPADSVVVLRCHPDDLERRLLDRGEPDETAAENAEAERYDLILAEAVEEHGLDAVYEIDTTDRSSGAVAAEIERAIAGDREPGAGGVAFLDG
jgi:adenylate kinase